MSTRQSAPRSGACPPQHNGRARRPAGQRSQPNAQAARVLLAGCARRQFRVHPDAPCSPLNMAPLLRQDCSGGTEQIAAFWIEDSGGRWQARRRSCSQRSMISFRWLSRCCPGVCLRHCRDDATQARSGDCSQGLVDNGGRAGSDTGSCSLTSGAPRHATTDYDRTHETSCRSAFPGDGDSTCQESACSALICTGMARSQCRPRRHNGWSDATESRCIKRSTIARRSEAGRDEPDTR